MSVCCAAAAYLVMRAISLSNSVPFVRRRAASTEQVVEKSETTTTFLKIRGITCSACVESINRGLKDIPGVLAVAVSIVTHEATVKHHNDVASADLIAELESLGYEAEAVRVEGGENASMNIEGAVEEADRERLASVHAWKLSLIGASAFTIATLIAGHLPSELDTYTLLPARIAVQAAFSTIAVLAFGYKIHYEALMSIRHLRTDMSLLGSTGLLLALFKSLLLVKTQSTVQHGDELLFESTAILTSVIIGGRFIKALISRQALVSVSDLSIRLPDSVTVATLVGDGTRELLVCPLSAVKRGDYLALYPGDIVPTDCVLVEGSGSVSETHISGEILPVSKSAGDSIFAGSANHNGQLLVKVSRVGSMTWLQKTLLLIIERNSRKSEIQEVTDIVASKFVAAILAIAISTGIWHLCQRSTLAEAIDRLIAVLLCACPCAIGLASPTAVSIAIALASKTSILIYGGSLGIEAAAKVTTILFDKTGTLTTGKLTISNAYIAEEWQRNSEQRRLLWSVIRAAEETSKHPVARAMVVKAQDELNLLRYQSLGDSPYSPMVKKSTSFQGQGLRCDIVLPILPQGGKIEASVVIGTRSFVSSLASDTVELVWPENMTTKAGSGNSIESHVMINGVLAASLSFEDQIRPETRDVVQLLKGDGYNVGMITGGTTNSATSVGQAVGIHRDWLWSDMMPEDKVKKIKELQKQYGKVAMVGDNLNDIQAMAAADFSVGAFIDLDSITAVSVDALLVTDAASAPTVDGLMKIVYLFDLARATYSTIRNNLAWTVGYNVITVVLSAGMLERVGLTLSPINAGLAMSLSSVMVVVHAMRLERWRPKSLAKRLTSV